MIACDTSSLAAFLAGDAKAADVAKLRTALMHDALVLPPATLAEALSNPRTAKAAGALLAPLPLLEPKPGYWLRVAASRAKLIGKGLKARLADALIAQSCIDADVKLITRDRDFRHFATHCGLKLA
jgi:predicted nucleic acid-binding protein